MNEISTTIWQTIEALIGSVPFSKDKVERELGIRLVDTEASGSDLFQFLEGGPVQLAEGVGIQEVDLRLKREGPHPGFLVLELEGRGISFDEVLRHYAELRLTGVPRGRSLDEHTSYTAKLDWGELSFGFGESNPACLAYVAFDPS